MPILLFSEGHPSLPKSSQEQLQLSFVLEVHVICSSVLHVFESFLQRLDKAHTSGKYAKSTDSQADAELSS